MSVLPIRNMKCPSAFSAKSVLSFFIFPHMLRDISCAVSADLDLQQAISDMARQTVMGKQPLTVLMRHI